MRANVFLCSGVSTSKGGCLNSTAEMYLFTSTKVSSGSFPRLRFVPSSNSICSGISARPGIPHPPLLNLSPLSYSQNMFWSFFDPASSSGKEEKMICSGIQKQSFFLGSRNCLAAAILQKSDTPLKKQNAWLLNQSFQLNRAIFQIVGLPIPVPPDNAHSHACIDPFLH